MGDSPWTAVSTRLPPQGAVLVYEIVAMTDYTYADVGHLAFQYYLAENPDDFDAFETDDGHESFIDEMLAGLE